MIKNRILFLLWTMAFVGIAITAQDIRTDVYTSNGSVVVAYVTSESSDFVRESYDAEKRLQYPNAIMIDTYYNSTFTKKLSSTARFNCHGYACICQPWRTR